MVEVESDEQARAERFPGSPTIRLDGVDAHPAAGDRAVLAHLPRLPAARRPHLRHAGPRGPTRSREEDQMNIGDEAPTFSLPDTDGRSTAPTA